MAHIPDIDAYISIMEEIKRRTSVVHALLGEKVRVIYLATQIETMALQIRMILELIALASLSANKSIFEENAKKFNKHWHPGEILKDIENINPGFFPQPIKEVPSKTPGIVNDLIDLKEGCMTREELIEVHGRCGNILHAQNPYGKGIDYHEFRKSIENWIAKIICLLNCHKIHFIDQPNFYLIHMKEDRDDRVHYYTFGPVNS
jgi:hypothetical protein